MKLTTRQVARGIYHYIGDENNNNAKKIYRFLIKKKINKKINIILRSLENIYFENSSAEPVTITSHTKLDKVEKQIVQNFIQHKITSRKIVYHYQLDPQILGGVKITSRDKVWDFSIKNKLEIITNCI